MSGMWAAGAAVLGSAISGSGARSAAKTSARAQGKAADLAYQQSLPWDVSGMFGSATFDEDGRAANIELDPEMQKLYDRYYARSSDWGSKAEAMGNDPLAMQQQFYEEQKALAAPGEQEDRLALENRLLSQGMFTSTGGSEKTIDLHTAQAMKDLVRRSDAMSQSQQLLDLYRTRESGDMKQALGIGALPYDYAKLGRGIGGGMSGVAQYGAGLRSQGAMGIGAVTANAWGGLGRAIGKADWGGGSGGYGQWGGDAASDMSDDMWNPTSSGFSWGE